jgi:hypothetical protein
MLRHRVCDSRLPAHIARQIIDEAEYWVKSTFQRDEPPVVNGEKTKRNIPYLLSEPIEGARHFPVRNVIATCSRDQVWTAYPDQHGNYQNSSTHFDFVVREPDGSIRNLDSGRGSGWLDVIYYLGEAVKPIPGIKMPYNRQTSWMCLIKPGSKLGVVPRAINWVNFIEVIRIENFSTFILEEEDGQHEALRRFKQKRKEILVQIWNTRKQTYAFVKMIRKFLRPGVRPGYKRLEWTCVSHFLQPPTTYTHSYDRLAENLSIVISKRPLGLLINLPPD